MKLRVPPGSGDRLSDSIRLRVIDEPAPMSRTVMIFDGPNFDNDEACIVTGNPGLAQVCGNCGRLLVDGPLGGAVRWKTEGGPMVIRCPTCQAHNEVEMV